MVRYLPALLLLFAAIKKDAAEAFSLASSAFGEGGDIPVLYSCDGSDISPPLSWADVPEDTRSLALLLQDPNATPEADVPYPWTHWVMYNIPANMTSLPESVPNEADYMGAIQGPNSWRTDLNDTTSNGIGYGGMCPNPGDFTAHTYPFTLYALSVNIETTGLSYDEVLQAMDGSIIEQTVLTASYQRAPSTEFELTSSAFEEGGEIPVVYSCDGDDTSPPLSWSGVPEGTASFALLLQDPNATPEADVPYPWTHWVMYNIPADVTSLPANVPNEAEYMGAIQGPNSWRTDLNDTTANGIGYGGMCPNPGDFTAHTYPFTLYALSVNIETTGLSYDEVLQAMDGSIIEQTVLTASYQRAGGPPTTVPPGVSTASPTASPTATPTATPTDTPSGGVLLKSSIYILNAVLASAWWCLL